jgi:hypothetical protein
VSRLSRAARFVRRLRRAIAFYVRLGYTWHLAWTRAERSEFDA